MSPAEILHNIRKDAETLRADHAENGATIGASVALGSLLARLSRLERETMTIPSEVI